MLYRQSLLLLIFWAAVLTPAAALEGVVVSIKPIHSLVSGLMDGVAEPDLIVDGNASPHSYSLKPSQAKQLQDASLIVWVGEGLETFLTKPISVLGEDARIIELMEVPGLTTLPFRESGGHDDHNHGHSDDDEHAKHEGHDEHAKHEGHDEHAKHEDHDEHAKHEDHKEHEGHGGHAGHDDHGSTDPHIWLDPENAVVLVKFLAKELSKADPDNASRYAENAANVVERLQALSVTVNSKLQDRQNAKFMVFHDAYQYFENRFQLSNSGSLTVNPEVVPGAARLKEIRERLATMEAVCIFSEPQFNPRIVASIAEGTNAKSAELDPLGSTIEQGPAHYSTLITQMADTFATCLHPENSG